MLLVSFCSCLYPIRWSEVLGWEWRCSWSSADRRCSNYIWVINNLIAYQSVSSIRNLTVRLWCPFVLPGSQNHSQSVIIIYTAISPFLFSVFPVAGSEWQWWQEDVQAGRFLQHYQYCFANQHREIHQNLWRAGRVMGAQLRQAAGRSSWARSVHGECSTHFIDVLWASWRFKSPATQMFAQ